MQQLINQAKKGLEANLEHASTRQIETELRVAKMFRNYSGYTQKQKQIIDKYINKLTKQL